MATATSNPETITIPDPSEFDKDEFIIDRDKLKLIAEVQEKLLDLFGVTVTYSDAFSDDSIGNKQWVEVEGTPENRKLAKEYVQTLCNPIEVQRIKYPSELEDILKDPVVYRRVERHSRAVIRFDNPGEVLIYGNDGLSVTLAYSALEDIISQHLDEVNYEPFPKKGQRQASHRLNEELKRRLSTEDGNAADEEDYTELNDAIKRTILDVLHCRNVGEGEGLASYGIRPHGKPETGYMSVHEGSAMEDGSSLGEAAKQLGQIQLDPAEAESQQTNNNNSCQPAASTSSSDTSEGKGKYLRDWALSRGYPEEKIQLVFDKHGYEMHFQMFYRALNNIGSCDAGPSTSTAVQPQADMAQEASATEETLPAVDPIKNSKQVVNYISKLSEDFDEEENGLNREQLIERNAERQRLLMDIFEKRKNNKEDTPESDVVEIISDDESEVIIEEDTTDCPNRGNNIGRKQQQSKNHRGQQNRRQQQNQPQHHRSRSPINHQQDNTGYNPAVRNFAQGRSPSPKRYRGQNYNAGSSGHQPSGRRQEDTTSLRPAIAVKTNKRYIVIDGSNVAFSHGNGKVFSCRGIQIAINYFLKLGHTEVTAFVPQWRTRTMTQEVISDQHLLTELKQQGYLVFTPSRRVPGKNIVCYDDRYVLRLAEETDGVVVSNDNYRDLWQENPEWRTIIENRLLMFSWVMDIFMPPDDPLGKDGPTLEQFLMKGDWRGNDGIRGPGPDRGQQFRQPFHQQSYYQHHQQQKQHHQQQRQQQQQYHHHQQQQQQYRPPLISQPPQQNAWNNRPQFSNNQAHRQHHQQQLQQQQRPPQQHGQAQAYNQRFDAKRQGRGNRGNDTTDGADAWQQVGNRRRPDNKSKASERDPKVTEQLRSELMSVFSENSDSVETVLKENPSETDLNTLSAILLNHMD